VAQGRQRQKGRKRFVQRHFLEDRSRITEPALLPPLLASRLLILDQGRHPRSPSQGPAETRGPSLNRDACLIHCHTCDREISAVATSSIKLLIAAAPTPLNHDLDVLDRQRPDVSVSAARMVDVRVPWRERHRERAAV